MFKIKNMCKVMLLSGTSSTYYDKSLFIQSHSGDNEHTFAMKYLGIYMDSHINFDRHITLSNRYISFLEHPVFQICSISTKPTLLCTPFSMVSNKQYSTSVRIIIGKIS